MKRMVSVLICCVMLLGAVSALAESWMCTNCGSEATGNFCSNCGAARGEQVSNGEPVRLDLDFGMMENLVFSQDDVKVLFDGEWIGTIKHGKDFQESLTVTLGKHTITFHKDGEKNIRDSVTIDVHGPTWLTGAVHVEKKAVEINGIYAELINADDPHPWKFRKVDGEIRLSTHVQFEHNANLSKYDVEMYMDGVFVGTIPHGRDYNRVLGVSQGKHVIKFVCAEGSSVTGISEFTVRGGDSYYFCHIQAKSDKIKVTKETIQ